jgi:hypothetical protein
MSRRYDVGFRDACHVLESDDVFWDSLLMSVLYVVSYHSLITVATRSTCISSCVSYQEDIHIEQQKHL